MKTNPTSSFREYRTRTVIGLLFRDFFSRYWWAFLLVICFSAMSTEETLKMPVSFTGYMIICGTFFVAWERTRGILKVYDILPVPRHIVKRMHWLEGVVIFPLLFMVCCFMIILASPLFGHIPHTTMMNKLNVVVLTTFMGMGYASIMMILISLSPGVKSSGLLALMPLGALFIPGLVLLAERYLWAYAIPLCVLVAVGLSYVVCMRKGAGISVRTNRTKDTPPHFHSSRFRFWCAFWVSQSRAVLACLLGTMAFMVIMGLLKQKPITNSMVLGGSGMFVMVFMPMLAGVWFNSARPLRSLPMSSLRLTFFLLALPAFNVICTAIILIVLCLIFGETDMIGTYFLVACAAICLGFCVCSAITVGGRTAGALAMIIVVIFVMLFWQVLALLSPVIGIGAFLILWKQLRTNSALYRRTPEESGLGRSGV